MSWFDEPTPMSIEEAFAADMPEEYKLQKLEARVKYLESTIQQFGPIDYPLIEIWDTAHSAIYTADNQETIRLLRLIMFLVDMARTRMIEANKNENS